MATSKKSTVSTSALLEDQQAERALALMSIKAHPAINSAAEGVALLGNIIAQAPPNPSLTKITQIQRSMETVLLSMPVGMFEQAVEDVAALPRATLAQWWPSLRPLNLSHPPSRVKILATTLLSHFLKDAQPPSDMPQWLLSWWDVSPPSSAKKFQDWYDNVVWPVVLVFQDAVVMLEKSHPHPNPLALLHRVHEWCNPGGAQDTPVMVKQHLWTMWGSVLRDYYPPHPQPWLNQLIEQTLQEWSGYRKVFGIKARRSGNEDHQKTLWEFAALQMPTTTCAQGLPALNKWSKTLGCSPANPISMKIFWRSIRERIQQSLAEEDPAPISDPAWWSTGQWGRWLWDNTPADERQQKAIMWLGLSIRHYDKIVAMGPASSAGRSARLDQIKRTMEALINIHTPDEQTDLWKKLLHHKMERLEFILMHLDVDKSSIANAVEEYAQSLVKKAFEKAPNIEALHSKTLLEEHIVPNDTQTTPAKKM